MSHKNWLTLAFFLLVIHLGFVGFAYFQFAIRSPQKFFGRYPNSNTFEITALNRPVVSIKALLNWVTLGATATFTFDFVNYQDQLKALADYFTAEGYDNFITSLQNEGTLSTIEEKKLILSAVAIGPAIVLTEEERGNSHTWRVQVPLLIRYQSANVNETRQQVVSMLITEVSTEEASKGIGIAQYNTREAGPEISS